MVKIFIKSNPNNYIFALILLVLTRIDDFLTALNGSYVISDVQFLIARFPSFEFLKVLDNPIILQLVILICLYLQAVWVNKIVHDYNLLNKPSDLPVLMFILCTNMLPQFAGFQIVLICNFLVLWILQKSLSLYKVHNIQMRLFDIGIIIIFGVALYLPFVIYLFLVWISLNIYRTFNWREWISPFLGAIAVLIPFFTYRFCMDESLLPKALETLSLPNQEVLQVWTENTKYLLAMFPLAVGFLISIIKLRNYFFRSSVFVRKSFQIILVFTLGTGITFYLNKQNPIGHFVLCVPTLAILLAYGAVNTERRWTNELIYGTMFVLPFFARVF